MSGVTLDALTDRMFEKVVPRTARDSTAALTSEATCPGEAQDQFLSFVDQKDRVNTREKGSSRPINFETGLVKGFASKQKLKQCREERLLETQTSLEESKHYEVADEAKTLLFFLERCALWLQDGNMGLDIYVFNW